MEYGFYWIRFIDPEFGALGGIKQPAKFDEKGWWVIGYISPWTDLPGCSADDFEVIGKIVE